MELIFESEDQFSFSSQEDNTYNFYEDKSTSTHPQFKMMHTIGDSLKALGEKTADLFKKDDKEPEQTEEEARKTVAEAIAKTEKEAMDAEDEGYKGQHIVNGETYGEATNRELESALHEFKKVSEAAVEKEREDAAEGDIKRAELKQANFIKAEMGPIMQEPAVTEKKLGSLHM